MDEKILDYMTKTEYASEYPGVVKNAEHADSATGSQFADNAIKLGGNESTYYASATAVTTLGTTVNGVLTTANTAQASANRAQENADMAKADASAAKSAADSAQAKANACIPKSDITEATGDFTTKVMSQKATTEQLNLCMKKADYDSDGDGVVERADHALSAGNSSKLEGKTEAELSVANAAKLGGHPANYFAQDKYNRWEGSTGVKLESGISANANLVWRDGETVHINLLLRGILNNGWKLATLPAACPKPEIPRHFYAACRKAANTTVYYVRATIDTAGVVSLIAESGDDGVYSAAQIEIAYPVK